MNLFEPNGWRVSRAPEVVARLTETLTEQLDERVSSIKLDEQSLGAGGSLHFSGVWSESRTPVLIKTGVNHNQLYWMPRIAEADPELQPKLFMFGDLLGNDRIGWMVMEFIKHGNMNYLWLGEEFSMLLDGAVRFQKAAKDIERRHIDTMSTEIIADWIEGGLRNDPPPPGSASQILTRLERDFAFVSSVCPPEVCHGDIQMCNGLSRLPPPQTGGMVLVDCQPIVQPWAFDAGYLQCINSSDTRRKGYQGLVPKMARIRTEYALPACSGEELARLERIVLGWYALKQWRGDPQCQIRTWGRDIEGHLDDNSNAARRYIELSVALGANK